MRAVATKCSCIEPVAKIQQFLSKFSIFNVVTFVWVFVGLLHANQGQAAQWNQDGINVRLDTLLDFTVISRTSPVSRSVIGVANGGTLPTLNLDDGDLNYRHGGVVSALARAVTELEVSTGNGWGVVASGSAYYDLRNANGANTDRTPLSAGAVSRIGQGAQLLSAYGYGRLGSTDHPVDFKIGEVPLSWGEAVYIANGIGSVSPLDITRLHSPTSTLRDAMLPEPMLSARARLSSSLSVEGFVEQGTETYQLDPAGSYFSVGDFLGAGGSRVFLSAYPPVTDIAPYIPGTYITRGADHGPKDGGQCGLAFHFTPPSAPGTEFGAYYSRTNSRLPVLGFTTGTVPLPVLLGPPAGVGVAYASSSRYFLAYPSNTEMLGVSLATPLPWDVTLRAEASWRIGQPLQIDPSELAFAALTPLAPVYGANQLGSYGFGQTITGFKRYDVVTVIANLSRTIPDIAGADALETTLEAGVVAVPSLPGWDQLRFAGAGAYTSGNPLFTLISAQPYTSTKGFATRMSGGYRAVLQLDYYNAFSGVSVFPHVAVAHDVAGTTPGPLSNFVQDRKALSVGVTFTYLDRWRVGTDFTHFFGAGAANLLRDRDYLTFVTQVSL